MNIKKAFYPCCARDFNAPRKILASYVNEIYFCDINPKYYGIHQSAVRAAEEHSIKAKQNISQRPISWPISFLKTFFLHGDVREKIKDVDRIDVLFYRGDGFGEGGSNIPILDDFLPNILERFPADGGFILTDGAYGRSRRFKKIVRGSDKSITIGKHRIDLAKDQPYIEKYELYKLDVNSNLI